MTATSRTLDICFDVETLIDATDELGRWIAEQPATRTTPQLQVLAALHRQQRAALTNLVAGLDRMTRDAEAAALVDGQAALPGIAVTA